jgi:lauroyl/myristoyl acyltransferase
VKPRDVLTWKFVFYRLFLPVLGRLGPKRADAVLTGIGRLSARVWPPWRRALVAASARARSALGARWDDHTLAVALAASQVRYHARDYLLDTTDDAQALGFFDVAGEAALEEALGEGRGVVLVGSHLGGHIAAFHWLYRSAVPLRLMVQRPRHVSASLNHFLDGDEAGALPQSGFFLRRGLGTTECVARLLRVRAALREGKAVYLAGDIPWHGPNTRTGWFLGQPRRVLSVWADVAALLGSPVFFVFCTHTEGGRYSLRFEAIGRVRPGEEGAAVSRHLSRLEAEIAAHPADAPAHLLWPCYGPPCPVPVPLSASRPSRRMAAVAQG